MNTQINGVSIAEQLSDSIRNRIVLQRTRHRNIHNFCSSVLRIENLIQLILFDYRHI